VDLDSGEIVSNFVYTFKTEFDISTNDQHYSPNDAYPFSAFFCFVDKATNKSVPILGFRLRCAGAGDFSTLSTLSQGPSDISGYDAEVGPTTDRGQSYSFSGIIVHSLRAQAITYSMFAINWILTLCSIITTSVMFNRRGEVKDGFALLPITVILTIPVTRNLYSGSPPYGIFLDAVGLFPQMLTVVTCTVVVLFGIAMQSIRGNGAPRKGEEVQC